MVVVPRRSLRDGVGVVDLSRLLVLIWTMLRGRLAKPQGRAAVDIVALGKEIAWLALHAPESIPRAWRSDANARVDAMVQLTAVC